MKNIKFLLLSMLLGGAILADASSLTVNAQTNPQTTASVHINDGGFLFKPSDDKSFSFPNEDFTFEKRESGLTLDSSESFTINFEDNRQVANGYNLVATLTWTGDAKLADAKVILNSNKDADIKTTLTNAEKPTVNAKVTLSQGLAKEVIVADRKTNSNQGVGPWSVIFKKSQLEIPANTLSVGTHSATIEWTQSIVPQ